MAADHINVMHPDRYSLDSDIFRDRLTIRKLQVELENVTQFHAAVSRNLEAIFTRIGRGDPVELHYPDGRVFVVTGVEKE